MKQKRHTLTVWLMIILISFMGCSKEKNKEAFGKKTEAADHITGEIQETSNEDFGDQEIVFSKLDYFYSEDTVVEILCKKPGRIYYTTDGSIPSKEKNLYFSKAIKLIANYDTKANCIKAKAFFTDGTESKTIVHTYFVGENVQTRFDTMIFAVSTDPYNLYDYEYGIFVEGKIRDDFISENPKAKIDPGSPANYNMRGKESEREVYLEVFEPDGTKIAGHKAGIRTYGGWSRARAQKSIKIYARKEYEEENNKLRYEFFPSRTDVNGKVIDTFKQLVLRNCGNDNGFAFVRDELFQTLAGQAGYQDYEAVRPAALFVNGEYRGFFWLHEVYCDEYFEDHYGKYDGNFKILEGGETFKNEDDEDTQIVKDYKDLYSAYSTMDLKDNVNYKKLCDLVDVENYLSYYALQIYIGNEDWPHNNYKTYRYYTAEGEEYGKAPFDGKWRYLFHDMDYSTGIYDKNAYVDNIQQFIGPRGEIMEACPLFGQLMRREDCKEIFIKKTLDLINGAFAPDNFNSVLEEMNASRLNELGHTYNMGLMENWVTYDQLNGRLNSLREYALQRASHILTKYQEYFSLDDVYQLTVTSAEGCKVKINTFETDKNFTGSYYTDYKTTLNVTEIPEGKKFDYWLVNGKRMEDKELIVTKSMITGGIVEIAFKIK